MALALKPLPGPSLTLWVSYSWEDQVTPSHTVVQPLKYNRIECIFLHRTAQFEVASGLFDCWSGHDT